MKLDLRRPMTVEEVVEACVAKIREDAKEETETVVEIMIGTEMMLDLALRVLALEARLPRTPGHAEAAENRP